MNFKINTEKKTVTIIDTVGIDEFVTFMKRVLPENDWKDYVFLVETKETNWVYPNFQPYYVPTTFFPQYDFYTTSCLTTADSTGTSNSAELKND